MRTIGKKNGNGSVHSTANRCPHCGGKIARFMQRYGKCPHCKKCVHTKAKEVKDYKTGEKVFKIGKIVAC